MLVQQARIAERWIACDCLADGEAPPILTPAFLSEADTYYLRRLTSPKRPEHRTDCPFFREQATNRLSEVRTQDSPADRKRQRINSRHSCACRLQCLDCKK